MIASLTGTIVTKDEKGLVMDVAGVGYRVEASSSTLGALSGSGKEATVLVSARFSDREGIVLYGFADERERTLFLFLIEVPGVGPRGAVAILSAASVAELEGAIASGEEYLLTRVSGIGKKKAQKIMIELRERYEGLTATGGDTADVLDALESLGVSGQEARAAVRALPRELGTTEEKIREALKGIRS